MAKELKTEQLENATGGSVNDSKAVCHHCGFIFNYTTQERRTIGEGCDKYTEVKCPSCGEWSKL